MNIDKEVLANLTEKDVLVMTRIALSEYEIEKGRLMGSGKAKAFMQGFEKCLRELCKVKGIGVCGL